MKQENNYKSKEEMRCITDKNFVITIKNIFNFKYSFLNYNQIRSSGNNVIQMVQHGSL
jgi:hypothetical protein